MKTFVGIWIDRKKAVIVTNTVPERSYEEGKGVTANEITEVKSYFEQK